MSRAVFALACVLCHVTNVPDGRPNSCKDHHEDAKHIGVREMIARWKKERPQPSQLVAHVPPAHVHFHTDHDKGTMGDTWTIGNSRKYKKRNGSDTLRRLKR
jgi:hypothetical protein